MKRAPLTLRHPATCAQCGATLAAGTKARWYPGGRMKTNNGRPVIVYHYRGLIERGPRYDWREGWSETTPDGRVCYPWATKAECRAEAKAAGCAAQFVRHDQ